MADWRQYLKADPLPWLLDEDTPAVRAQALRDLAGFAPDDRAVLAARAAAMTTGPIAAILANQQPEGYWVKPGPGYAPKYTGTVWQVIFLDQLGADPNHPQVRAGCDYLLDHASTVTGGFGCYGVATASTPPPSSVIHCLNGNLLRAVIGFGRLEDERVQKAIDWQARSITGEGFDRYHATGASGPGFACGANDKLPCAWGAVKAMLALARVPEERREPHVRRAVEAGATFLLSRDPAKADYPVASAWGNSKPSGSWFKLGFPSGYVADVLQTMEALCALGCAQDTRLAPAVEWLLAKQDAQGRWRNEYAYHGKTWIDFEKQGAPSKWVTLRACRVLKAVSG